MQKRLRLLSLLLSALLCCAQLLLAAHGPEHLSAGGDEAERICGLCLTGPEAGPAAPSAPATAVVAAADQPVEPAAPSAPAPHHRPPARGPPSG